MLTWLPMASTIQYLKVDDVTHMQHFVTCRLTPQQATVLCLADICGIQKNPAGTDLSDESLATLASTELAHGCLQAVHPCIWMSCHVPEQP